MSSTEGAPALRRRLSLETLTVAGALAAAVALAWAWLAGQRPGDAMAGMAAMPGMTVDPWSAAYLLPAFAMWGLMMVAMMLPSAAPMILLHARLDRAPSPAARLRHSALFVLAYVAVWSAFSAAAAILQAGLVGAGLVSAMALTLGDRALAAVLLAVAAAYQLSAAKRACLDTCRSPIHFILRLWRPGAAGALRLGLAHGLYCLGCCWALMLLLFVGGVMNLAWIAALAALVLAEKYAPAKWHVSLVVAAALIAGAAALALSAL